MSEGVGTVDLHRPVDAPGALAQLAEVKSPTKKNSPWTVFRNSAHLARMRILSRWRHFGSRRRLRMASENALDLRVTADGQG